MLLWSFFWYLCANSIKTLIQPALTTTVEIQAFPAALWSTHSELLIKSHLSSTRVNCKILINEHRQQSPFMLSLIQTIAYPFLLLLLLSHHFFFKHLWPGCDFTSNFSPIFLLVYLNMFMSVILFQGSLCIEVRSTWPCNNLPWSLWCADSLPFHVFEIRLLGYY